MSFRDVEDLLAKLGVVASYESVRQWCAKLGPGYANSLKRRRGRLGDHWFLDEMFVKIRGELHYLWRAVEQDGGTIDILMQKRRNKQAAKRFLRKLLKGQCELPRTIITDKLKSYSAAHREFMPSVTHSIARYENNRAEVSHEPTRAKERSMWRFKSAGQAQRFLTVHGAIGNLFRLGRHLIRAVHYREFRSRAFSDWQQVTCAQ